VKSKKSLAIRFSNDFLDVIPTQVEENMQELLKLQVRTLIEKFKTSTLLYETVGNIWFQYLKCRAVSSRHRLSKISVAFTLCFLYMGTRHLREAVLISDLLRCLPY